jgi:PAS domain S-box-containing protein
MPGANLLRLIESVEPGVVILSGDLSIRFVSRTTLQLFGGVPASRFLGNRVLSLHSEQAQARVLEAIRQAREAQRQVPLSLEFATRDGQDHLLLVKLTPLLDADMGSDSVCALFYDITSLVFEERKLIRIPASMKDEIKLLKPEEISFVRAANIYSEVGTASGEHHCDMSLGVLEKRLPPGQFFRIHRSYLVSISHISKVDRDHSGCAVECGGAEVHLPISRDKVQQFLALVGLK